ncbi:MAG: hypothetical protein K2P99_05095, partial [Burkholderiales bacterium]|nr:hypothetical protein [Burkholderiales bacterium]
MNNIQFIFPILVLLVLALRLYLNNRQAYSIKKYFNAVPSYFKEFITLGEHQKSGKYTLEKLKIGNISSIISSIILIVFTTGG